MSERPGLLVTHSSDILCRTFDVPAVTPKQEDVSVSPQSASVPSETRARPHMRTYEVSLLGGALTGCF